MKITSHGYSPETEIGFVFYSPNWFEQLIGIKPTSHRWKLMENREWKWSSGGVWLNMVTGKYEMNEVLDCAKNLTEI